MTDPKLAVEVRKFIDEVIENWDEGHYWLGMGLNGHPRAQDFEPTGHGGSDPTAVNGTRLDRSFDAGREIDKRMKRIWKDTRWVADELAKNMTAERPKPKKDDTLDDEFCTWHRMFDVFNLRDRGEFCRPCCERRTFLNKKGVEFTIDEVRHHADPKNNGRWPRLLVDPKNPRQIPMTTAPPAKHAEHIARLERLQLGTKAMDISAGDS